MKDLVKTKGKIYGELLINNRRINFSPNTNDLLRKKSEKRDASSSSEDEVGIAGSNVRPIKLHRTDVISSSCFISYKFLPFHSILNSYFVTL